MKGNMTFTQFQFDAKIVTTFSDYNNNRPIYLKKDFVEKFT